MDELRLAIRRLTKRPGATIVSIVTLACAIGAAAATWSLLSAVLLRPLPVKDADRLVIPGTMQTMGRAAGLVYDGFIYPNFPVFRDSGIFEQVAAEWSSPPTFPVSTGGLPVRTSVGFATFDFFDVLGLRSSAGTRLHERRRSPRRAAGRDPDGCVLAPRLRRPRGCHRPHDHRQGKGRHDRRRRPAGIPRPGSQPRRRSLPAVPHDRRRRRRPDQSLRGVEPPELAHVGHADRRAAEARHQRRASAGSRDRSRSGRLGQGHAACLHAHADQHRGDPCARPRRHGPVRAAAGDDGRRSCC